MCTWRAAPGKTRGPVSIQGPPLCTPPGGTMRTEPKANTSTELSGGETQIRTLVSRDPLAKHTASLPRATSHAADTVDPRRGGAEQGSDHGGRRLQPGNECATCRLCHRQRHNTLPCFSWNRSPESVPELIFTSFFQTQGPLSSRELVRLPRPGGGRRP